MKAIMISIKPQWCAKIMNGEKTIEVRKNKALANAIQKLIDVNGYADIYVYCTKGKPNLWLPYEHDCFELDETSQPYLSDKSIIDIDTKMNGKVIFKFHCYKVETILPFIVKKTPSGDAYELTEEKIITCQRAQLTYDEYNHYLQGKVGYAIHISDLEIFDDPKKISEFKSYKKNIVNTKINGIVFEIELDNSLTKAPQNLCYVEVE